MNDPENPGQCLLRLGVHPHIVPYLAKDLFGADIVFANGSNGLILRKWNKK